MKIYIAGKITGDPKYRDRFRDEAERLEGMRKAEYMRICFAMIDCADTVFLLPGWKGSPGARLEQAYCSYTGKPSGESWEVGA